MEKFEKHIKEKLEARKIEPSEKAWEKISGELAATQKPKPKRRYGYAIAAVFVGLLVFLGILFLNTGPNEKAIPMVKEDSSPKEILKKERSPQIEVEEIEVAEAPREVHVFQESQILPKEPATVVMETEKVEDFSKMPLQDSAIVISEDIINTKVTEVLRQVTQLESIADTQITDAEVDSLLRTAQREILTDKLLSSEGKVDAMALLTEVEDELDESFRDQIFEALKQGYLKVRTAVADRNN
ncbi:hypothetical protein [Flagellimonas sp.]|uniref:hypothetical protein n=1 Tax=Flagellimonas sp. TaxID=2058762 RepID=UPI003F4A2922